MLKIPARHDHVGSFLRPEYLLQARAQKAKGEINAEQLRAVEDKAITEIVRFQESVGLKAITDGEFRRTYFHIDFLEQLGGVATDIPVSVLNPDGTRALRSYALKDITRWQSSDRNLVIYTRTAVDLEERQMTLQGDSTTIRNTLDTLTCCCMQ